MKSLDLSAQKTLDLPGLPPIPKPRGRPKSDNPLSVAERKRRSRDRASDRALISVADLSESALVEGLAREIAMLRRIPAAGKKLQRVQVRRLLDEISRRVDSL